jgi:hypothetical protein
MPVNPNTKLEAHDIRVTIPPALLEMFIKEPRLVVKYPPAPGLIPVDIAMMKQLVERLGADRDFGKQFNEGFEVVIVAR